MPSSLWLILPKEDHPFNKVLTELIVETLPSDFPRVPKNTFIPHVTITSDIDPEKTYASTSAQQWLDNLRLPDLKKEIDEATIELEAVEAGDPFFKKLTLRAKKDGNLVKLAAKCREQGVLISEAEAQKWAGDEYLPHLSLMYADMPKDEVQKKVGLIEMQLGWSFGSLFDCCGGTLCMGAKLVLVDTSKAIDQWRPIAEREVSWVRWTMARGLI
jgi:2',3'-cyclic-nucleotide 3'-phosphodiesterase